MEALTPCQKNPYPSPYSLDEWGTLGRPVTMQEMVAASKSPC